MSERDTHPGQAASDASAPRAGLNPAQLEFLDRVDFTKAELVPAIVQSSTGRVLMLAYQDRQALELSLRSGETHFYSRSRNAIWHKGATSGNRQRILEISLDCDGDAILMRVENLGPACHSGTESCFDTASVQAASPNDVATNAVSVDALTQDREPNA